MFTSREHYVCSVAVAVGALISYLNQRTKEMDKQRGNFSVDQIKNSRQTYRNHKKP